MCENHERDICVRSKEHHQTSNHLKSKSDVECFLSSDLFNYDQRIPVENGSFLAWGYLTYTRPLTEKQASDYELRPAPDNPDRPRPIAEQMKNAAKLAEADRGSEAPAPQRRQPDRGDR